ncbi:MAG TPA: DUF6089 family protein [Flavobacteriales bacterium]
MRQLLLFLLLLSLRPAHAQVSELGLTGGAMYYIGDLNPQKHYPKHTALSGGIVYRYNFTDRYALRLQGLFGRLEAYDSESPDTLQQLRNLGFRSNLFEASALIEVNFLKYRALRNGTVWTPFIFVGLAYYHFNPTSVLNDTRYELQPLGTEGQGTSAGGGEAYKLNQMAIVHGAGFKFALTQRLDLQLEWGLRRTYTDYLDDVSGLYADNGVLLEESGPLTALLADPSVLRSTGFNTGRARGDVNTRDWYQYTGISLTFRLTKFTECDAMWDSRRRNAQR